MMAPIRIGRRRARPGAMTATRPTATTVINPIQVSKAVALTPMMATGARLRPITATMAPVTTGGMSFSTQRVPDMVTIQPMIV